MSVVLDLCTGGGSGRKCGWDLRLMDKILHDLKDPKLWELWYIPYYGSCRILSINRRDQGGSGLWVCASYTPLGTIIKIMVLIFSWAL